MKLTCSTCKEIKPTEGFARRNNVSRGYAYVCKACINLNNKDTRTKEDRWDYQLQNKYGITLEQYEVMLENQNGSCHICGTTACQSGKRMAVDHNHVTNKVRGILCFKCNTGLGKFNDDITILEQAVSYLKGNI